jgi:ferredoxin
MATLNLNGSPVTADLPADMPLLWALRDVIGATGTKFGCGIGACGACTVHLDGQPVRSCVTPLSAAEGKQITTIEAMVCQAKAQTEMVLYPGGSHRFFERGKPSHRLDAIQRLIEWVNRWIDVPVEEKPGARSGRGEGGEQPARQSEPATAK